jgi:hypothetical protein
MVCNIIAPVIYLEALDAQFVSGRLRGDGKMVSWRGASLLAANSALQSLGRDHEVRPLQDLDQTVKKAFMVMRFGLEVSAPLRTPSKTLRAAWPGCAPSWSSRRARNARCRMPFMPTAGSHWPYTRLAKPSQARRCDQLAGRACQDIWRGIGNSDSRVAAHGSVGGECPRSVGRVGVVASLGSQDRRGPTMRCLRILPTFDPVSDRSPFVLRAIEKAAGIVALRPPGSFNWVVLKCCLVRLPRQAQN